MKKNGYIKSFWVNSSMPYYEYECSCGHRFEYLRPMRESHMGNKCPRCGSMADRVMSTPKWLSFPGSLTYDRINNYTAGYKPNGVSAGDKLGKERF
jgi:putative FmdB family regulatory protein